MKSAPIELGTDIPDDARHRLSEAFKHMMKALYTEDGAQFRIEILEEPDAQDFITTHASVLDEAMQRAPLSDIMRQRLQQSNWIFSGIKTFHELNEAFPALTDENGNRKPFERFLNDVRSIDATYNRNYLRAEYNFVNASADMAARWEEFAQDGNRYNLQYRTAGDEKVRPEHAALHGVTLPFDDPFWRDYFPPNGWNCRCTVVQVRKSKYPVTPHDEAVQRGADATGKDTKGIFRFNSGLEQKSVPDYNPYTIRRCRDCDIAKGKVNLAANIPENELCQACQLLRKCKAHHLQERKKEYQRLLNDPDYKNVQFDEKTGALYAEHRLHSSQNNNKERFFGNMTGIDLEKEYARTAFRLGHSVIMRQEGTIKEIIGKQMIYNRELDTVTDGKLADIASITKDKPSYEYVLLHKNRQLMDFNVQHGTDADTVILYFHDQNMYSEERIRDSIDKLCKLHHFAKDENGKVIKDENGNPTYTDELYEIFIRHVVCVTKTGTWKEFDI